jgi:very-short-patch-repair endonuclease
MAEVDSGIHTPSALKAAPLGSTSPRGPVDHGRVKAQMRRWQDRVLDLTKSNPLIGLNRSRVSKLQVIEPDGDTLFARFFVDENQLRMPLVRKRTGQPEQVSLLESDQDPDFVVEPGDVTFDAKPLDIMRRLRRIHDNAHTTMEERGVTTLYLTFGALRWKDEMLGESVSPLWMVPCEFEDKGPDAPLRLCPADEDSQINPALEYYLRERHKIELPDIPEEADAQALAHTLRRVRSAVQEQKWEVSNEVWLSTFSFESLVIYRDLRALTELATANPIVVALSRASAAVGKSEALPQGLDSLPIPATVPIPVLPTDSSQLEALTQSALGRHVVVHGPPGTGKSQTIANLIADALARNKKVLFVSAKMAALNVVYERLKELGLQRFCLEAHSTKAGKQKIIDELRRTLEAETAHDGDALDRELQALLRVREELNAYARELHAPVQPLGLSVFRANARLAQLCSVADVRGPLPWPNPLDASRDELDQCIHALEDLAGNAPIFDQGTAHPWYGFAPTTFGLAEQESLESCLSTLVEFDRKVTPAADTLECLIPGARLLSIHDWDLLKTVLIAIAGTDRLPKGWWEKSDAELSELAQLFADAADRQNELDTLAREINKSIKGAPKDVAVLLAPAQDRFKGWHSVLKPGYWRWRKEVQANLSTDCKFTRARVATLGAQCQRALEIEQWFAEHRPQIAHYLDPGGGEGSAVLRGTSQSFTAATLCKKGLDLIGRDTVPVLSFNPETRNAAKRILDQISNAVVVAAVGRLDSDWPQGFIREAIASRAPLPEVSARATTLLSSVQRARERVLLNRALQQCASRGLSLFLASFGSASAADAPQMFERRFLKLWLSSAIDRSQALSGFTEAKGNDLLEKFRNLDARVRRLAVGRAQMTASAASARVRAAEEIPENASEVGILRRELQKRKRIKPLRKLFAEIPHVLQALKPCLLMSPISVSTYLKPDVFHFDLVVFDEASQLPTAEAIPAVLRASQVVVAGDPKQLPPTSFFEASLTTEEEEDDDDGASGQVPLESFLDDCVAVVPVFQEAHLRWHYRSRDERLIKFSNHFFYDNRLITFPAANPNAGAQGVRFVHVKEGVYDRGRSRTNRLEARAVATLAREHFECYPERSLGIVALNLSQKEAIEDAISELKRDRPDLAPLFDPNRDNAVFVKSLENVQGDERDTMIISVGYGRDQAGGFSMNFGPIIRDGGWRRLNVLVTRAKWECILVASVRALDFADVNPNNRGALALRDFLEFTERNGELPAETPVLTAAETNEFEEAVRAALIDRGLKVDMQVGASRYRIDLAVRDPRDDRRYLLGVECDGATYHSARNARDRDLLRQLVLQRMGWRIHRVWSTEWFHERERAIDNILRSVEQAQRSPITQPVYAPSPDPTSGPPNPKPPVGSQPAPEIPRQYKAGIPYLLYQPSRHLSRDHLLDASHSGSLSRTIAEVVKTEGPIHREMVFERLKQIHGVARAGSNVQANIERALRAGEASRTIARDPRSSFYYEPGHRLESFRLPMDSLRRPIEYIAPSEIALAILYLVEDQFGVIEESLPQAVARLFGIERLRAEGADQIRAVIEDLVAKGSLRRAGIQVHLA